MGPIGPMGALGPMGPMRQMGPMGPMERKGPMRPMGPMRPLGPMGPRVGRGWIAGGWRALKEKNDRRCRSGIFIRIPNMVALVAPRNKWEPLRRKT